MSEAGLISVVVVDASGHEARERCLAALAASSGVELEVIVVEGQATEATRRAIASGHGEHVALVAGHAMLDPDCLRTLRDAVAADPSVAAACATLLCDDDAEVLCARGGRLTWLGVAYDEDRGRLAEEHAEAPPETETTFPSAAAMLLARRDWDDCGGFDPALREGFEEADLGWRLWLLGRRVVVCRDAIARTRGSRAVAGERRHPWASAVLLRQAIRMAVKYYPPRFLLHVLWSTVRDNALGGRWATLAAAFAWNALHLPGTLARRRWLQSRRRTAHEELFRRGVILESYDAPPALARRAGHRGTDFQSWIPSIVLLPGRDSALGRLGPGWYPPECEGGVALRWTSGAARCALRVAPGAAGELRVRALVPGEATVTCNGAVSPFAHLGGAWRDLVVPVRADAEGRLDVTLRSPAAVRTAGAGGGPRLAGVAVCEIRFVPDTPPPPAPPASVSVIIPTYNRWPILAETLAALAVQTMREFEVIVVDDGSTDGTWESLLAWRREHPGVALTPIRQENLKPGRARNRGLQQATGDLVLFLGDDIVPRPDFLARHLARHREVGETIGVLGLTEWDSARMRVTPFLEFVNTDGPQFAYGHFTDGGDVPFTGFYTSNVSLPRAVLGEEPFHPAFTFVDWEDIELGYRLSLRGLRLIYHAGARAVHFHPTGVRQFYRRQEHVGRTIGVILGLHPELAASPAMPPLTPYPWFRWARHLAPAAVPLLERWDRRGRRCPIRLYRNLLLCAFWNGRRQALAPADADGTAAAGAGKAATSRP